MAEKENKSISVLIAGRHFPVITEDEQESMIHDVVNEVNEKVKDFQMTYTNKDLQDCLSMALLTYAVELHKLKAQSPNSPTLDPDLNQRIEFLDSLVSQALS